MIKLYTKNYQEKGARGLAEGKKYRHEYKILLRGETRRVLRDRMAAMLEHDRNGDGYDISSLYFDDVHRSAFYEKVGGSPDRIKYRIRVYNGSDDFIRLECKEKVNGMVCKRGVRIDRDIYRELYSGETGLLSKIDHPVARETVSLMNARYLRPSVIVNYTREAFVHPLSTTRITFDSALRVPVNTLDLFAPQNEIRVFPRDETILEIKYDDFLPAFIAEALANAGPKEAASKFVYCTERLNEAHIRLASPYS